MRVIRNTDAGFRDFTSTAILFGVSVYIIHFIVFKLTCACKNNRIFIVKLLPFKTTFFTINPKTFGVTPGNTVEEAF